MQRKFLDHVTKKLNIKTTNDWGSVTIKDIQKLGGKALLKAHKNSLLSALQSNYPETNWDALEIYQKTFFHKQENRRKFLDVLASKYQIKTPNDWGKISRNKVRDQGGYVILRIFRGSLFECLKDAYPEVEWNAEWFIRKKKIKKPLVQNPSGYWAVPENQKKFLEELRLKYEIKEPRDWGKVPYDEFRKAGGISRRETLEKHFPDINWKGALPIVEKKYWLQIENRRRFFEELSGKLNIKSLSDWGKVPQSTIKQHGGSTLLRRYGGALIGALRDAFPDIEWKQEWFASKKKEKDKSQKNQEENSSVD